MIEVELHIDLVAGGTEPIQAAIGDFLGHENAGHVSIVIGGGGPVPAALTVFHTSPPPCPPIRLFRCRPRTNSSTSSAGSSAAAFPTSSTTTRPGPTSGPGPCR